MVGVFGKPKHSFTYVKPSTSYPHKSINKKFESCANEYKQYLIAQDYKPSLVDQQFQEVSKLTRTKVRAKRPKNNQVRKTKFLPTYNPSFSEIDGIIRKQLSLLHSDDSLNQLFPANIFSTIFKDNKNLKELLAPSKYPNPQDLQQLHAISLNFHMYSHW